MTTELKIKVQELVDKLNEKYPTNYDSRLNYHLSYYKNKGFDITQPVIKQYICDRVLDKPVTFYQCEFNGRIIANARKSENVIELTPELFKPKLYYSSGYKREQRYFDKYVKTLEDRIKWVVVHEYCHLLYPTLGHTNEFFNKI